MKNKQVVQYNKDIEKVMLKKYGIKYYETLPSHKIHNLYKCVNSEHGIDNQWINASVINYSLRTGVKVDELLCWECQQKGINI